MKPTERPFNSLPKPLLIGFMVILLVQVLVSHFSKSRGELAYHPLPEPLTASVYRIASVGSDQLMSYLLAIRLQLHDNQLGKHIRYEQLDYPKLTRWLDQINDLNIESEYPSMLASRVYSQTTDKKKQREIIDFIQRRFTINPQLNWRRMAEATILARHSVGDLELALLLAEQLSNQPVAIVMPFWARDMQFILLGEMTKYEAGVTIIVALLNSGIIDDPDEQRFLKATLLDFNQRLLESKK